MTLFVKWSNRQVFYKNRIIQVFARYSYYYLINIIRNIQSKGALPF